MTRLQYTLGAAFLTMTHIFLPFQTYTALFKLTFFVKSECRDTFSTKLG